LSRGKPYADEIAAESFAAKTKTTPEVRGGRAQLPLKPLVAWVDAKKTGFLKVAPLNSQFMGRNGMYAKKTGFPKTIGTRIGCKNRFLSL
jgi:hypothetical protein